MAELEATGCPDSSSWLQGDVPPLTAPVKRSLRDSTHRSVAESDNDGWSLYGAPWLQSVATGRKRNTLRNRKNEPKPLPSVATNRRSQRMVRSAFATACHRLRSPPLCEGGGRPVGASGDRQMSRERQTVTAQDYAASATRARTSNEAPCRTSRRRSRDRARRRSPSRQTMLMAGPRESAGRDGD